VNGDVRPDRAPIRSVAEGEPVCAVCGEVLAAGDVMLGRRLGRLVCRRADCQLLMARLAGMPVTARESHFVIHRSMIRSRREREALAAQRAAAVVEAEARVDRQILDDVRRTKGSVGHIAVLPIPTGLSTVAPLSPERRERYRRHLQRTIAEAIDASEGGVSRDREDLERRRAIASERFLHERPTLDARCRQACNLCKGGCCSGGGDHAFVSTVTIRRLLDADPSLTAEDILRTYLSYVPARSIGGACVNQTATGCALPREWRSDTCNAFFCGGLQALQKDWDEARPPDAVLVIRRAHTNGSRFAAGTANPVVEVVWVDEDGVRPVEGRR
jgi:hypothetical protein